MALTHVCFFGGQFGLTQTGPERSIAGHVPPGLHVISSPFCDPAAVLLHLWQLTLFLP